MTAAFPERLEAFIQAEVATGRYATREDVIATAVQQMQLWPAESGEMANLRLALAELTGTLMAGEFDRSRTNLNCGRLPK